MDLSIFLILIFVTLQFCAEYFDWNQTKVKFAIFIITLIITLPNAIFMTIDWWQSPHSKFALLVQNTFEPILRGETHRLFRALKSVGVSLACDDLNHLPITRHSSESFEFYMTRECLENDPKKKDWMEVPETKKDIELGLGSAASNLIFGGPTKSTFLYAYYDNLNEVFHVWQLKLSRRLTDLYLCKRHGEFLKHPLFTSSLMKRVVYKSVDRLRAQLLLGRLQKIVSEEMPILTQLEYKREWLYFHAVPTLDNLNGDLVLVKSQGACIAVGGTRYTIMDRLQAMLNNRRWCNADSSCEAAR